jgi:ABC-type branched-subunit amino acid transport system ATPase component
MAGSDEVIELSGVADRPHAFISEVKFKSGLTCSFRQDSITVIVGPNNSGKSVTLREAHALLAGPQNHNRIVERLALELTGTDASVTEWIKSHTKITRGGATVMEVPLFGSVHPGNMENA